MYNCVNTVETHLWFTDKEQKEQAEKQKEQAEKQKEHVVYMRFTRMGIFYKNTHYFFAGTPSELNHFMLTQRNEIAEAKKEIGFGRGDHDNLWDTPLGGSRPPTTNLGSRPPTTNLGEDGFERAEPFAEPFAEPLPFSHWKLYLYANEEEFKAALHQLETQTHTDNHVNGFPDEIIYINQINK